MKCHEHFFFTSQKRLSVFLSPEEEDRNAREARDAKILALETAKARKVNATGCLESRPLLQMHHPPSFSYRSFFFDLAPPSFLFHHARKKNQKKPNNNAMQLVGQNGGA
jgi:hypothetical protein